MNIDSLYQTYYVEHVVPNSVKQRNVCNSWAALEPTFGRLTVRQITPSRVNAFVAQQKAKGKADGTILNHVTLLKTALNYAVRTGRLESAPYVPLPPKGRPRSRHLTDDELQRLLDAAEKVGGRGRLFVWIALETAARRRSIETLRWDQVDFENGLIDFGEDVGKKRRAVVPISSRLDGVLRAEMPASGSSSFVLGNRRRVTYEFDKICREAGLENVTPHDLRRTWATNAARRGVSMTDISRVLGNSVTVAESTYAKFSPDYLRSAVE